MNPYLLLARQLLLHLHSLSMGAGLGPLPGVQAPGTTVAPPEGGPMPPSPAPAPIPGIRQPPTFLPPAQQVGPTPVPGLRQPPQFLPPAQVAPGLGRLGGGTGPQPPVRV